MSKSDKPSKSFILLIRNPDTGRKKMITVTADCLEAAKLKIPEEWVFMEYARVSGHDENGFT